MLSSIKSVLVDAEGTGLVPAIEVKIMPTDDPRDTIIQDIFQSPSSSHVRIIRHPDHPEGKRILLVKDARDYTATPVSANHLSLSVEEVNAIVGLLNQSHWGGELLDKMKSFLESQLGI